MTRRRSTNHLRMERTRIRARLRKLDQTDRALSRLIMVVQELLRRGCTPPHAYERTCTDGRTGARH